MSDKEQAFAMIEGRIDTIESLCKECVDMLYKIAYNEAIEAAAEVSTTTTMEYVGSDYKNAEDWIKVKIAGKIRELKK